VLIDARCHVQLYSPSRQHGEKRAYVPLIERLAALGGPRFRLPCLTQAASKHNGKHCGRRSSLLLTCGFGFQRALWMREIEQFPTIQSRLTLESCMKLFPKESVYIEDCGMHWQLRFVAIHCAFGCAMKRGLQIPIMLWIQQTVSGLLPQS